MRCCGPATIRHNKDDFQGWRLGSINQELSDSSKYCWSKLGQESTNPVSELEADCQVGR